LGMTRDQTRLAWTRGGLPATQPASLPTSRGGWQTASIDTSTCFQKTCVVRPGAICQPATGSRAPRDDVAASRHVARRHVLSVFVIRRSSLVLFVACLSAANDADLHRVEQVVGEVGSDGVFSPHST